MVFLNGILPVIPENPEMNVERAAARHMRMIKGCRLAVGEMKIMS